MLARSSLSRWSARGYIIPWSSLAQSVNAFGFQLTSYLTMGAATDNLESDKYIHCAQKEVNGSESIIAIYSRSPVTPTFQ